jgi:8-oxo-dGTP diphosphatase
MRTIVNGLLTLKGRLLLAKRGPHRASYPRLWTFPGGHVEANETLPGALVRELREEIGISPTAYTYIGAITDPNTPPSDRVTYHMYSVTAWEGGEPTLRGDEHSELAWIALEAAASMRDLALEEYRALFKKLAPQF